MINAKAKIVAVKIGIPFSGTKVVSIYLIEVSIVPEPKRPEEPLGKAIKLEEYTS